MLRTYWKRPFGRTTRPTVLSRKKVWQHRFTPSLDSLDDRILPAVTASFSSGTLNVIGDTLNNTIVVSRDAAGRLLVNGGAVAVRGGTPTVANTSTIQIFGLDGNDQLALDEANGALPKAQLFGGAGNDVLTGGSAADLLFGQAGNDTLLGKGGNDFLFGGADNDTLTGGTGDDQVFGEAGNDRMIWNPGEATDLNEGGDGNDTTEVNGGNGTESFTVTANGTRVRFDRLDPAPFSIDIGTTENLVLNANGGNDSFSATGNLAALIQLTVDGGTGNDTLLGSNGADLLLGGDGNDFIDGQQGNDDVRMGAGDDVFQWDPGDGSDIVEGQDGQDRMLFNGSNIGEIFDVSANGARVRFTRNIASIVMDLNDVEAIDLNTLGGVDTITVNDLSGTDLTELNVNLASTLGGATGDGQIDTIIVNGTNGNDTIDILGNGTSYAVAGLPLLVNVSNSEGANDALVVNALGGNDAVSASTLNAGILRQLTIDGGTDNDTLLGSRGVDFLLGGDGNDFIDGQQGNDVALMGAGNDVFQWDPGDGSDTIEGEDGFDTMTFHGANINENINISANGSRLLFTRDVANITMDANGLEQVNFNALGGTDIIAVGDLTGTGVEAINLDLAGALNSNAGDGQVDQVIVNGTNGSDNIDIGSGRGKLIVKGLAARVTITHNDPSDQLTVNALGGDDTVSAAGLVANVIELKLNGGAGIDLLIGSKGNDLMNGGTGNDMVLMGAGDDTFVWNPGDGSDIIEGQDGVDTMTFNGANIAEVIDISANGQRLRFTRNVASITMDADGVERVNFNALGGADTITVNDLSGTDVTEVNLNLSATGGVGDGQADTVIINGTNGDDVILAQGDQTGVAVLGLSAQVNITGAESSNDRLVLNALDGDDVIQATGLTATAILLTENGGNGDDVLIGGDGNDTLLGGAGDDILIGGPGNDILDGGTGNNILIQ